LEGAKAAFDFAFCLGAGGDQMGDAQSGESALELRTGIAPLGGGIMPEQGKAIGVKRQRQAVQREAMAEVLEMVPGGVGWDKGAGQKFAGMIIHGQQEGLLVLGWPPLVDGGVVLPEFTQPGTFPAAAGLGDEWGSLHQQWEVMTGVGGDGFAITLESEAGGQFIGDELIVRRSLERQEGLEELLDLGWPVSAMVAAGEAEGEGGGMLEPDGAQAKEVSTTDIQELGGGVRINLASVECVKCLAKELDG
jgi:hypothetical protein